jgi:hypothetical protein
VSSFSSCLLKSISLYGHAGGHFGVLRTFSAMLPKGHAMGERKPGTLDENGRKAKADADLTRKAERSADFNMM